MAQGETVMTVVGNLTGDPELRYTASGVAVANFTIASTPRVYDSQTKEYKDGEALFLKATVWKEFAEHAASSLGKGMRVVAQGRLQQRSYEDKEGNKRSSLELEVDAIGPDLRFATASVNRSTGNRTQATNRAAAQTTTKAEETWGAPATDTWSDETPF